MKARWGFDLDMSAVRLMRREGGHWLEVQREKIDGPDIEERLMGMVDKLDPGTPVDVFLPRDQILYTDVNVSSESAAQREIEKAMDGRTPYTLDELQIDWVLAPDKTARVAAIALETLDEARAFAEARGLAVSGFSSLAAPEDFPRMPDFGGGHMLDDDEAPEVEPAPAPVEQIEEPPVDDETNEMSAAPAAFTSTRKVTTERPAPEPSLVPPSIAPAAQPAPTPETSVPAPAPATPEKAPPTATSTVPVVKVDDPTPVMQVRSSPLPPLNPGAPLRDVPAQPRVRTDIAAGTLSGAAATLSARGPSIRVHSQSSAPRRTLIVFAVAALMTIGIAIIVWSILPMSPGRTGDVAPDAQEQTAPAVETAESEVTEGPAPEALVDAQPLADAPQPEVAPVAPESGAEDIARAVTTDLAPASPDDGPLPQTAEPLEPRPASLADLETTAPVQSLDGGEDITETTLDIYLASIERRDLAFDAIALPPANSLAPESVPDVGTAPSDASGLDVARLDPAVTPETADTEEAGPSAPVATIAPDEPEVGETVEDDPNATPAIRPTELAAALPDRAPRARPGNFVAEIERQTFGGRTREELARLLPPPRPASAQKLALAQREAQSASDLAVDTSAPPRNRPEDFDAIVAAAVVQARTEQTTASLDFETPDTSSAIEAALAEDVEPEPRPQDTPRLAIPSSASVARQATIENALSLNKINLVGVYGVPSDRRALIRLPSGRYVKVKVGDRVDGGTVAQISDDQLIYRKGSRSVALSMPQG